MSKFKIGDRIKFYSSKEMISDVGYGTIAELFNDGLVGIDRDDENAKNVFHPKQLRKLKPKRKPRSVEVFMHGNVFVSPNHGYVTHDKIDNTMTGVYIKVRITEVLE